MEEKTNYKLYLAKGKNPPQGSIVGDFKKPGDESFVCEIILNDDEVEKAGCVDAVTTVFPDKAVIYVTADMLDALQDGSGVEENFELYHELGHLACGHYDTGIMDDGGDGADPERIRREEMEADSFAASVIGSDAAAEALKAMLKIRAQVDKRLNLNGTENSVRAIRELRARIDNVKNP